MGTIEDKLKYLAKTKVDLMNALKAKGAPIDESTPLSEYDVMVKAIKGGEGSTIKVYSSVEAMRNDKAKMKENDVCEIIEHYDYIDNIYNISSFNNVTIPKAFITTSLTSMSSFTVTFANADNSEYLTLKKAMFNSKLTILYKLKNQSEVALSYSYSTDRYTTTNIAAQNLLLNFSETLNITTSISSATKPFLNNIIINYSRDILTYVYKFVNGDFQILQGFNESIISKIASSDITDYAGNEGDICAVLQEPSLSPIVAGKEYPCIVFADKIDAKKVTVGTYTSVRSEKTALADMSATYTLTCVVSASTITFDYKMDFAGTTVTILGKTPIYQLNNAGTYYELQSPVTWGISGHASLAGATINITPLIISESDYNPVFECMLDGMYTFDGLKKYMLTNNRFSNIISQHTAYPSDIVKGKTAYSRAGNITGTANDYGKLEITPRTTDITRSAGFMQHLTVKGVTADIDSNIKPDNIRKGRKILNVEGSNKLSCLVFNSIEEANAYTDYKVNDLVMIKKLGWRPFYPVSRVATSPSTKLTIGGYSSYRHDMDDILLRPKSTVTLKEPITGTFSKIIEGEKSNAEMTLTITETTCDITFYDGVSVGSSRYTTRYTSTDGLTYTNTLGNKWFKGTDETALVKYAYARYSLDIWKDVINDWDNMKILAEFMEEGQEYHIEQIYQYQPASFSTTLSSNVPYYTYDLDTLSYDSTNEIPCVEYVSEGIILTPYIDFAANNGIIEMGGGNTTLHGLILFKNGDVGYFEEPGAVFDGKGNGYVFSYMDDEYYSGVGYICNIEKGTVTTHDKTEYPKVTFTYPESSTASPTPMRKICNISEAKALFMFDGSGTTTSISYIDAMTPLIAYSSNISATSVSIDRFLIRPQSLPCTPQLIPLNSDFI